MYRQLGTFECSKFSSSLICFQYLSLELDPKNTRSKLLRLSKVQNNYMQNTIEGTAFDKNIKNTIFNYFYFGQIGGYRK